jgi:hypothetical protein
MTAHIGQSPEQQALGAADSAQWAGQCRNVAAPVEPGGGLSDVMLFSASHAAIEHHIERKCKTFSA